MELKKKLIRALKRGRDAEQEFIQSLSDENRSEAGKADAWAAKDECAHMAVWQQRRAISYMAWGRGEAMLAFDDYNRINAEDFESNRGLPWSDVQVSLEQGSGMMIDCAQALTEEQLRANPDEGPPMWVRIIGVGFTHSIMHITDYLFRHDEVEKASALWEEAVGLLVDLDQDNNWQGTCRYNLACSYARSGQAERAVETLREALRLNPGLVEWSKSDSDFNSIRERPDYQALYEN